MENLSLTCPIYMLAPYVDRQRENFNPRTREGCDTGLLLKSNRRLLYFNPRTREGCDTCMSFGAKLKKCNFNPRTREGCDSLMGYLDDLIDRYISIHAPVKGATSGTI